MNSIKNSSMTKRNKEISKIFAVLLAVYNRLKEKSIKNRMVKELSTNKGKISKQKTVKYLNNNLDEADRLLNLINETESTEQAANNIIRNITNYENYFMVPFPSGIPAPSPSPVAPSPTPSVKRKQEKKETQAEAIARGQEQLENPNPQINASSVLPSSTQEAQQIEREQAIPLSRMTEDDIISEYADLLSQLGQQPPITEAKKQNIKSMMKLLSDRYKTITNQVLNQQSLIDAFDEENRNVSGPEQSSASGAPLIDRDIELEQPSAPEAGASGDPIEDVQQEAVSGGSEQVQQEENINRPLSIDRFNDAIRQSAELSRASVNQLVARAPEGVRPQVREILNGNVSAQNILRGVVGLGMLYGGVSPAAQTVINSVLDIAQNSGVNVDRYFNRPIASNAVEPRVAAIREIPEITQSYVETYNTALDLSLDSLQNADPVFGTINREQIYLTTDILRQQLTDNIDDENTLANLDIRTNNFLDDISGSVFLFGQPNHTADDIIGAINDEINVRREMERLPRREEAKRGVDVEAEVPATSRVGLGTVGAGIGVGFAAGAATVAGGATTGLGAGVGGALGGAVGGIPGAAVGGAIGETAERLLRQPITVPPDTLKVVQQESKGTGKLRPKFIIPSVDILQPTNQQIQADQDEWNMFDFVNPTSEGANGTAATNPLKLQALQEDEIRYRGAGVDVHPMFNDDLPFTNEQLTEYFIGAPLPALPEMKFQENEEEFFNDRGMPQLSLWQKYGGYDPQNQSVAIDINSPFRNFTNVTQLDEDINNSVLYGSIPFIPNH